VIEVINKCKLVPGTIVVDTTSGDPIQTKILTDKLFKEKGIIFIDCPVSGLIE
jgi:3-hydroxyisobutyrate dehydrogenase-like beta-hydroxyacid dehydrogenase